MFKFKGEFLYTILKPIARLVFYNKFNVVEGENVLPKKGEAFIIVGHHVSAFDPIILNGFASRLIRFLYADANTGLKVRAKFLVALDMIPFSKNSADFKSIRVLKQRVSQKQAVGIYPEGGASWDGSTDKLILATSKLIKMMNVPIYGVKYNGAYLSKPRWAKNTRRGKVIMNTYKIFSKEDIKKLSYKEIHKELVDKLKYNEFEWQGHEMIKFKGKDLAEYIERLLYKCPECQQYNSFSSKGNEFACSFCGLKLIYNEYGLIEEVNVNGNKAFKYNLVEWNSWQQHDLIDRLSKDNHGIDNLLAMNRTKSLNQIVISVNDHIYEGSTEFNVDHIVLGTHKIMFKDVKSHSITFGRVIEFYYNNDKYHLEFLPKAAISIKLFYDCIEYFKEVLHES